MQIEPKILNIKQLAQKLGVPTVTVRYWLRHNKLNIPYIDGSKPKKFRASDVEAYLKASEASK